MSWTFGRSALPQTLAQEAFDPYGHQDPLGHQRNPCGHKKEPLSTLYISVKCKEGTRDEYIDLLIHRIQVSALPRRTSLTNVTFSRFGVTLQNGLKNISAMHRLSPHKLIQHYSSNSFLAQSAAHSLMRVLIRPMESLQVPFGSLLSV